MRKEGLHLGHTCSADESGCLWMLLAVEVGEATKSQYAGFTYLYKFTVLACSNKAITD